MVEKLHCNLKALLRVGLTSTKWLEELPLILLGLCTTVKKELNCSAAEALYGTTLWLPAQYSPQQNVVDMTSFINRLSSRISEMAYYSPAEQNRRD